MKVKRNTLIIAALAVTLIAAVAVSQTVAHRQHMHGMGMGMDEHMLSFLTNHLDLTEAQQAQVKDILAKEKQNPASQQLRTEMQQAHQDLMKLEMTTPLDENAIRQLAAQHAHAATELLVQSARIHNEIYQLLTPEQKAKAVELMNRHQQHMMEHQAPQGGGI